MVVIPLYAVTLADALEGRVELRSYCWQCDRTVILSARQLVKRLRPTTPATVIEITVVQLGQDDPPPRGPAARVA